MVEMVHSCRVYRLEKKMLEKVYCGPMISTIMWCDNQVKYALLESFNV